MQLLLTTSMQGQVGTQFHPDSAWKRSSNLQEIYNRRKYSRKLLMMSKGNARNI